MTKLSVQYLEYRPPGATPAQVRRVLRQAAEIRPIEHILLGWGLPLSVEQIVAEEAARLGATLYRWQPWLTGEARLELPPEWATRGALGTYIPGHGGLLEFTFACPNRSAVAEFLEERLQAIAGRGIYQGIFLDRIRFPSPAADPLAHLGCFCSQCTRMAADRGLDLEAVRRLVIDLASTPNGARRLCLSLLGAPEPGDSLLEAFLDFRQRSITRCVEAAYRQAQTLGLAVGLDCFSPALVRMVGQDLGALEAVSAWMKLMIYPRVMGPAGLSFELLGLWDWLAARGLDEQAAGQILSRGSRLPLPPNRLALRQAGLPSAAIAQEVQRGRQAGVRCLLAGIALVALPDIHDSTSEQLQADLTEAGQADGIVASWDLWHIPQDLLRAG